jgi:hypothetical protein
MSKVNLQDALRQPLGIPHRKREHLDQDLIDALVSIARGREDNGRALGGSTAQDVARSALFRHGINWSRP